tara:strand:- start:307 stop:780 length:474 start_codon:yes stop_codon:yes gene_type:complete
MKKLMKFLYDLDYRLNFTLQSEHNQFRIDIGNDKDRTIESYLSFVFTHKGKYFTCFEGTTTYKKVTLREIKDFLSKCFEPKETIFTLDYREKEIIKKSLELYRKALESGVSSEDNGGNYKIHDIRVLEGYMNYKIDVILLDTDVINFSIKNGVDLHE